MGHNFSKTSSFMSFSKYNFQSGRKISKSNNNLVRFFKELKYVECKQLLTSKSILEIKSVITVLLLCIFL